MTYENCFNLRPFFKDTCVTFSNEPPSLPDVFSVGRMQSGMDSYYKFRVKADFIYEPYSLLKLEFVRSKAFYDEILRVWLQKYTGKSDLKASTNLVRVHMQLKGTPLD